MIVKKKLKNLPETFSTEEKILLSKGINDWESIISLTDKEINEMVFGNLASIKNFHRIKCMAIFISELGLEVGEAGLLMHSGLASVKALSSLTPEELIQRTGRLERLLKTGRKPLVSLSKACSWIKQANQLIKEKK